MCKMRLKQLSLFAKLLIAVMVLPGVAWEGVVQTYAQ